MSADSLPLTHMLFKFFLSYKLIWLHSNAWWWQNKSSTFDSMFTYLCEKVLGGSLHSDSALPRPPLPGEDLLEPPRLLPETHACSLQKYSKTNIKFNLHKKTFWNLKKYVFMPELRLLSWNFNASIQVLFIFWNDCKNFKYCFLQTSPIKTTLKPARTL